MNIKELTTFGKRLEFLLDLKEIQRKDLADAINISATAITNYIKDNRKPDLDILARISDFLNVNSDFLLLRNDDYQPIACREKNGKLVQIKFKDATKIKTEKEISDIFEKLDSIGFDLNKLL